MESLIVYIVIVGIVFIVLAIFKLILRALRRKEVQPSISEEEASNLKPVQVISQDYHYERRDLIMTRAENDFFKMLDEAVGDNYYVFPRVHLSSLFAGSVTRR